ncbi:MAG: 4-hydroxy-tetrahydrodipicolinate synthase, partial [Verrucomicrobiota bacterium]
AGTALQALARLVEFFPLEEAATARRAVAAALRGLFCQKLLPRSDARGRVPATAALGIDATARGRVPVVAGTGSNSTREAVLFTRQAHEAGSDAMLVVAPYYNKPSQEGLFRHFSAVAEATAKPIMLYSIPGRCGVEISVETVLRLRAKFRHVIGIKEAGGQVEKAARLVKESDAEFIVLSGDDSLTLPVAEVGAQGVISVASNLIPGPVARLAKLSRTKQFAEAKALHDKLAEIFRTLFVEPNPVPVKHCMMRAGIIRSDEVRLPLCEMSEANRLLVEKVADATLASLL